MKKTLSIILALVCILSSAALLASCGSSTTAGKSDAPTTPSATPSESTTPSTKVITIAVPNDTTNEARALLLLENLGIIEIDGTKGQTATIKDITSNPKNIQFVEVEAAQLPNKLEDVDYAIINSNFALSAGINPTEKALAIENAESPYANILAVKAGNETSPKILALKAALESKAVADYISATYGGSVVSVVANPGDGYDASVNYEELKGTTITVAATPDPHAQILKEAKKILEAREITLEIKEYNDYIQPNNVVDSGEVDANYFQHIPYLNDFNKNNGTNVVSVLAVHVEPMGIYAGKGGTLNDLTK